MSPNLYGQACRKIFRLQIQEENSLVLNDLAMLEKKVGGGCETHLTNMYVVNNEANKMLPFASVN